MAKKDKEIIVSTLTIPLIQEEVDLLEVVKIEVGQNVATKVFKTLMLYPQRYKDLSEELRLERIKSLDLQKEIKNQKENYQKEIKDQKESHTKEVERLNNNILEIKSEVKQFFSSFDTLKRI